MEMNRRQFCALGTAGALAAIAGGVSLGCSSEGASKDAPAAAAAPQKEDTPGVTSQGMPRASRASICSRMAP